MMEECFLRVGHIAADGSIPEVLLEALLRIADGVGVSVVGRELHHCAGIIGPYHGKLRHDVGIDIRSVVATFAREDETNGEQ